MVEQVATVLQVVFLSFLHVPFSEQVATVLQVPLDNLQLGRRGAAKAKQRARTEVVRLSDPFADGGGSGNLTRPEEPRQSEQPRDIEEPAACAICSKVFSAQSYLEKHTRAKHGEQGVIMKKESDEKPHKCDLCKKEFKQASHLKVHITKVHQPKTEKIDEDSPSAESKYKEMVLDKGPPQSIRVSEGVSEEIVEAGLLKCGLCGTKEPGETALIEHKQRFHVKTCEDGVTFECEFCAFKTQKVNFIKTHIKFMHK